MPGNETSRNKKYKYSMYNAHHCIVYRTQEIQGFPFLPTLSIHKFWCVYIMKLHVHVPIFQQSCRVIWLKSVVMKK